MYEIGTPFSIRGVTDSTSPTRTPPSRTLEPDDNVPIPSDTGNVTVYDSTEMVNRDQAFVRIEKTTKPRIKETVTNTPALILFRLLFRAWDILYSLEDWTDVGGR